MAAEPSEKGETQGPAPSDVETVLYGTRDRFVAVQELVRLRQPNGTDHVLSDSVRGWLKAAAYLSGGNRHDGRGIVGPRQLIDAAFLFEQHDGPGAADRKAFLAWLNRRASHPPVEAFRQWLAANAKGWEEGLADRIAGAATDDAGARQALVDPAVAGVLADAEKIKIETDTTSRTQPVVDTTHLMVAILGSEPGRRAVAQMAENQSWEAQAWADLIDGYARVVASPAGASGAWATILEEMRRLSFPPETVQPIETLPGYESDSVETALGGVDVPLRPDPLGAVADARAMARIICHRQAEPPLAIGLFAQWGGGKSTFMKLLRRAIDETTALAAAEDGREGQGDDAQGRPGLVRRVVHIEFNAWHYVDANLWASFATHIFKELRRTSQGGDVDWLQEAGLQTLSRRLETVQQAIRNYSDERTSISGEIATIKSELETLRRRRETLEREAADIRLRDIASSIEVADLADVDKQKVDEAVSSLGLQATISNVAELQQLWAEARGLSGTLRSIVQSLAGKPRVYVPWVVLGLFVFAVVSIGIPWAVESASGDNAPPWLVSATAATGRLTAALAGAAAWLIPHMAAIKRALAPIESAVAKAAKELEDRRARNAELIQRKEAEIAGLAAQEVLVAQRVSALTVEENRLERLARGEDPIGLLTSFLEDRATSARYSKHLGLISIVHQDFERMASLLTLVQERQDSDRDLPAIDRIVLYIDDLDRCRDEQVVEVLEAVHLLLALPLFVVVVGVDVRWLDGALGRYYAKQLGAKGQAQPVDYLGKIFQIPFWLPRLRQNAEAYARLTTAMVGAPAAPPSEGRGTGAQPPAADGDDTFPDEPAIVALTPHPGPEDYVGEHLSVLRQLLELEDAEKAVINALHIVAGQTPRTVKRFVNIYRIIRARQSREQLDTWLGRVPGVPARYPAVLLALGIETGLPADAAEFVEGCLSEADLGEPAFMQLLERTATVDDPVAVKGLSGASEVQDWLCRRYGTPDGNLDQPRGERPVVLSHELRRGVRLVRDQIVRLSASTGQGRASVPDRYPWSAELRKVYAAGEIKRFSFRRQGGTTGGHLG